MKKLLTVVASLLVAHLFIRPCAFAVAQTIAEQLASSTSAQSAALKKTMNSLNESAAEIDRFLKNQAQQGTTTPDSAQAAALQKAKADLDASAAQLDKFIEGQAHDGNAAPDAAQSEELKKAMTALDASAAQLNKFVNDDPASAAVPPSSAQTADLQKTKADLTAIEAELDKFIKEQTPEGTNSLDADTAAKLHKAMADLDASSAQINQFVQEDAAAGPAAPVELSSRFGSRSPRQCPLIATPPNPTQAAVLVQCTMDYETPQQARLQQDIVVQLSSPRNPTNSDRWPRIDSRSPVLDLAVNATVYLCGPILEEVMHNTGTNCDRYHFQSAPGVCWKTIDGSYRCQINAGLPTNLTRSQPPPTTY